MFFGIYEKIFRGVFLVTMLSAFCLFTTLSILMIKYAYFNDHSNNGDTVIVLGSKIIGDKPGKLLSQRLDIAKRFLLNNPNSNCIVTGGKGEDEDYSEAYIMNDYLSDLSNKIYSEDRSTSTYENLLFSLQLIEEINFKESITGSSLSNDNIVIISNDFHVYRASYYAKKLGYTNISTISAPTPSHLLPIYWIRECFAILKMYLFD